MRVCGEGKDVFREKEKLDDWPYGVTRIKFIGVITSESRTLAASCTAADSQSRRKPHYDREPHDIRSLHFSERSRFDRRYHGDRSLNIERRKIKSHSPHGMKPDVAKLSKTC